jgi:hypothetical protein
VSKTPYLTARQASRALGRSINFIAVMRSRFPDFPKPSHEMDAVHLYSAKDIERISDWLKNRGDAEAN